MLDNLADFDADSEEITGGVEDVVRVSLYQTCLPHARLPEEQELDCMSDAFLSREGTYRHDYKSNYCRQHI
jgi:hypothetical protein